MAELKWNNMGDAGANSALANLQAGLKTQAIHANTLGETFTNLIDKSEERFNKARDEAKDRNAQLLISQMNNANSLEDIQKIQASLNEQLGVFGSNIDLSKYNTARKSWEVEAKNRNDGLMALRDTTPEAQSVMSKASELIRAGKFKEAEAFIQQSSNSISPSLQAKLIQSVREHEVADRDFLLKSQLNESNVRVNNANARLANAQATETEKLLASKIAKSEAEAKQSQTTTAQVQQDFDVNRQQKIQEAEQLVFNAQHALDQYNADRRGAELKLRDKDLTKISHILNVIPDKATVERLRSVYGSSSFNDLVSKLELNIPEKMLYTLVEANNDTMQNIVNLGSNLQRELTNNQNILSGWKQEFNNKQTNVQVKNTNSATNSQTNTVTTQAQEKNQQGSNTQVSSSGSTEGTETPSGDVNRTVNTNRQLTVSYGEGANAKKLSMNIGQTTAQQILTNPKNIEIHQQLVNEGLSSKQAEDVILLKNQNPEVKLTDLVQAVSNAVDSADVKASVEHPTVPNNAESVAQQAADASKTLTSTLENQSQTQNTERVSEQSQQEYTNLSEMVDAQYNATLRAEQQRAEQEAKQKAEEANRVNYSNKENMKNVEDEVFGKPNEPSENTSNKPNATIQYSSEEFNKALDERFPKGSISPDRIKQELEKAQEEQVEKGVDNSAVIRMLSQVQKAYPNGITAKEREALQSDTLLKQTQSKYLQGTLENNGLNSDVAMVYSEGAKHLLGSQNVEVKGNLYTTDSIKQELFNSDPNKRKQAQKRIKDLAGGSIWWDSESADQLDKFFTIVENHLKASEYDGVLLNEEAKDLLANYAINALKTNKGDTDKFDITQNDSQITAILRNNNAGVAGLNKFAKDYNEAFVKTQNTITKESIIEMHSRGGNANADANAIANFIRGSSNSVDRANANFNNIGTTQGNKQIINSVIYKTSTGDIDEKDLMSRVDHLNKVNLLGYGSTELDKVKTDLDRVNKDLANPHLSIEAKTRLENEREQLLLQQRNADDTKRINLDDPVEIQKAMDDQKKALNQFNVADVKALQKIVNEDTKRLASIERSIHNLKENPRLMKLPAVKKHIKEYENALRVLTQRKSALEMLQYNFKIPPQKMKDE